MAIKPGFLTSYLPYILRRADQVLSAPFYEALAEHNIGRSEWRVLAVLEDLGELPVLALADAALSPQPTVTHALRRLEKRGLVRRTTGEHDRRTRFISITPTGTEVTRALMDEALRLEQDALRELGGIDELIDQLSELANTVRQAQNTAYEMGA